ncbi:ABC transporter ATP-binding protein [Gulosibacter sp. 10]|uniref:ABC transporter ATP-binding protein n=1 Tax=Gulosibacter sp. 10 TaxID=1255570 RepID=UPI00097EC8D4|nr:ABC transporter ATP-binding protein [Gulosibacter sp. 10]SJM60991.1 Lipid A export ATP-binding/permease protein MsbA [Gulosibacter sp. 10]
MLRTLTRLLPAPERRRLSRIVAWFIAAAALHGIVLGLVGVVIAAWLGEGSPPQPPMIALAVAAVLFVAVQWTAQMVVFRTGTPIFRALHERLGDRLAELPLGWFTPERQTRAITAATEGVPRLMSYPALLLRPIVTALVAPVTAAGTMLLLDWRYSAAVLLGAAVAWTASRYSSRLAQEVDARRHRIGAEATDRVLEYAERQPLIRTDRRPGDEEDLVLALDEVRTVSLRSSGTVIPGILLFGLTLNVLFAALIAIGALWISHGSLAVPVLAGVLVVVARLSAIASAGAELAAGLRLQRGELERLAEILDAQPLPVLPARPGAGDAAEGDSTLVRVEGAGFAYDRRVVVEDLDFVLPERGLTAIVGPSGAGKTTIARLLARFWDPDRGRILFEGGDIRMLAPEALYRRIGIVFQDDHLMDATIGENIRVGRPDAKSGELRRAARAAGLEATIAELPEGLDTPVGPGGSRLSGGQRQRVAVARALLKAAPLTIMDEATSALDPENARIVTAAAKELSRSGSVVVIAHNLDTILRADQILLLEEGRIVGRGTHGELLETSELYRRLVREHGTDAARLPEAEG